MSEKPAVNVENEQAPERHWFKRHFYRREGDKHVLDLKRFSWAAAGLFALLVILSFIQAPPPPRSTSTNAVSDPPPVASSYSFSELGAPPTTTPETSRGSVAQGYREKRRSLSGPKLIARPKIPVPPGSIVRAVLLDAATDGPVRARVLENVSVKGEVAVAANSTIMGTATSVDDRLLIRFHQMMDDDGKLQTIQAQVIDPEDRMVGLKGSNLKGTALKLAGGLGLNFLGGMSEGLQEKEAHNGAVFNKATIKNALLNGASRTALEQSREFLSDVKNTKEKYKADAGRQVLILFEGQGS